MSQTILITRFGFIDFRQSTNGSDRGHPINQAHVCCFCNNLVRLHIATGFETGQPMTIANRTAHFRRLISENLGVRGSRVSIGQPIPRAVQLGQLP